MWNCFKEQIPKENQRQWGGFCDIGECPIQTWQDKNEVEASRMMCKKTFFVFQEMTFFHRTQFWEQIGAEVKIHRCLSAVSAICKAGVELPGKTIRPKVLLCPSIAVQVMPGWVLWGEQGWLREVGLRAGGWIWEDRGCMWEDRGCMWEDRGAECRQRDWPGVGRKSWAGAC